MISPLRALTLPLVLAVLLPAGCGTPRRPHPAVGRTVGPLALVSATDEAAKPPALAGRVTLLNFWGTWCPPCQRELPGLARLAERLADEPRFQLVAVSCSHDGSVEPAVLGPRTRSFLERAGLPIAAWVLADPLAADMLMSSVGLEAFPTSYLVGPDARIVRVWVGYEERDEAEIAAAVSRLLSETADRERAG